MTILLFLQYVFCPPEVALYVRNYKSSHKIQIHSEIACSPPRLHGLETASHAPH